MKIAKLFSRRKFPAIRYSQLLTELVQIHAIDISFIREMYLSKAPPPNGEPFHNTAAVLNHLVKLITRRNRVVILLCQHNCTRPTQCNTTIFKMTQKMLPNTAAGLQVGEVLESTTCKKKTEFSRLQESIGLVANYVCLLKINSLQLCYSQATC